MKILQVCDKKISGVEYHRLLIPHGKLNELEEVGITTAHIIDHLPDSFFHQFDLIVSSSVVSKMGFQEILWKQLKRIGIPVIIDRDDTWVLPHNHPLKKDWVNKKTAQQITYNLQQANAVMVTTEHLSNMVSPLNKNVHVIPNAIDFNQDQFKPDVKVRNMKTDHIQIGWSGSVTHHHDLVLLAESFLQLKSDPETQNKYRLILSGFIEGDAMWKEYENIFTSGYRISQEQYCRINGMDAFTYASAYDMFDIGLIPLKDTPFNRCKSELKMLEMGAKKVSVIVSDEYPYTNIANNKKNCLTANKKEWFKQIKKLITLPELRSELSENLYNEVKENHNIEKVNKLRLELYKEVINAPNKNI
jgi:glycosyltransferase involved in cell wall biosynthesis